MLWVVLTLLAICWFLITVVVKQAEYIQELEEGNPASDQDTSADRGSRMSRTAKPLSPFDTLPGDLDLITFKALVFGDKPAPAAVVIDGYNQYLAHHQAKAAA